MAAPIADIWIPTVHLPARPSPASREREGPDPQGREGEGRAAAAPSPVSLSLRTISRDLGSAASLPFVLRQAQHEVVFFVASPRERNLILSLSKDEAAAPAAGNGAT